MCTQPSRSVLLWPVRHDDLRVACLLSDAHAHAAATAVAAAAAAAGSNAAVPPAWSPPTLADDGRARTELPSVDKVLTARLALRFLGGGGSTSGS